MVVRVSRWQDVDGVLLLDKAYGVSSNAMLQRARRALNARSAGHTGTLDPAATGLLIACFGEATKFSAELLDAGKTYIALARLGETSLTGDAEGPISVGSPFNVVAKRSSLYCASSSVTSYKFHRCIPRSSMKASRFTPMHARDRLSPANRARSG